MTREEKLQLIRNRQKAVRDAWSREKTLVCQGKGTVNWNSEQQRELMEKGRVSGYEGQHMKSVSQYPEYASSADNIQFLTHEDHLAAHNMGNVNEQNGYHSVTNGFYDPETHEMQSFGNNPPHAPEAHELSNPCYKGAENSYSQSNGNEQNREYSKLASNAEYSHESNVGKNMSNGYAMWR